MKSESTVNQEIRSHLKMVTVSPPQFRKYFLDIRNSILFALLLLTLIPICEGNLVATEVKRENAKSCEIQSATFEGWKAEVMSNQWLDLEIVPQLGGRLMQVTFDGHPFLFVNPKYRGTYVPLSAAGNRWINYGGDKIWPMPEGSQDAEHWPGPVSDQLDDGEYKFSIISGAPACAVRLDGPPDPRTGLQYSREIRIDAYSPRISFRSSMKNAVNRTIRWSVQTVTQYDTANRENPAEYNHDFWALTSLNPQSTYFGGYHVRSGLADDPSFSTDGNMFRLHWLNLENEVWLDSTVGWLAVDDVTSKIAMIERFHFQARADYPGNASIIFYKNGAALELDSTGRPVLRGFSPEDAPYYMEAEINSPMVELKPGEAYTFETEWFPTRVAGRITDVPDAGVIADPITATRVGNQISISGSVGAFFRGKLVAQLKDAAGKTLQSIDLLQVDPRIAIQLRQQIKSQSAAKKIQISLIDDHGEDRGILATVDILQEHSN